VQSIATSIKRAAFGLVAAGLCLSAVGVASAAAPFYPAQPVQPAQQSIQASPISGVWTALKVVDGKQEIFLLALREDGQCMAAIGDIDGNPLYPPMYGTYTFANDTLTMSFGDQQVVTSVLPVGATKWMDNDGDVWTLYS
jgi:hypothetical protein